MATRKRKKPTAQPRALQTRPTISFRTDRPVLEALDDYARHLSITRNDLMEGIIKLYLKDRGEDIDTLFTVRPDPRQANLDIFA